MILRWKELLIAFLMAVALWYGLSGTERLEAQIDVRVEYKGIPQNMVVRGNGLINKVTARISGPAGQIRAVGTREHTMIVDLSSLQKGENIIPIDPTQAEFFGGVEVISLTPSVLALDIDTIEEITLPLKPVIVGHIPTEYEASATLSHGEVKVRALSQDLTSLSKIDIPLQLGEVSEPTVLKFQNAVLLPNAISVEPAEVLGTVIIDYKRKQRTVQRSITLDTPEGFTFSIQPAQVAITLAIPEKLAAGAAQNKEIRAYIKAPDTTINTQSATVEISLPDGAQLVKVEPAEVTVMVKATENTPQ